MKPNDYINQDGCWNCKDVFHRIEYDQGDEYFCALNDTEKRPQCCSVGMGECNYEPCNTKVWHKWADLREVLPFGKCPQWVKGE